jgi:threonine dehydrogenase-like Zn-dependent dehydrogenase
VSSQVNCWKYRLTVKQCAARFALLKGAKKVYVIDAVPARLTLAQAAGPQIVPVNFKEVGDVMKHIIELEPQGLDGESNHTDRFLLIISLH